MASNGLTKAQYIKKADVVCTKERTQTSFRFQADEAKTAKQGKGEHQQLAHAIHTVLIPALEERAAALRRLGSPEGDEARVEAYIRGLEANAETLKRAKASTYDEVEQTVSGSQKLAEQYGYEVCR